MSNHPRHHKMSGFHFFINRMLHILNSKQAVKQEWDRIITMAQNNGSPIHLIHELKNKIVTKENNIITIPREQNNSKKLIIFTYYSPAIHKVANIRTNIKIAFRPTNTIYQQLAYKNINPNPSGIYQLKCNTCNNAYVGQSGRSITVRHKEHIRYIRNNNPKSAYATHILDYRHEFGPAEETLKLLKPCSKGEIMNCWETLYKQLHRKLNILISEQQVTEFNALYGLAYTPRDLQPHSYP